MRRTHLVSVALALATLVLLPAARPALAQAPGPGEVRGRVVDTAAGEPIVGASVAVWSPADSTIVTGVVVRGDGSFRIEGLPPGTYYARVTSIGYVSHRSAEFTIGSGSTRADLGTIRLADAPVEADEIQAVVERPTITLQPDRNAYLARDVAPAATSASEVLESVPSVQVDTDGKVSLRGNQNVAIQIDGRPAPVRGDQLAAYLQQLPANAIDRVEVIPTPSAAEDPEGMAGIINIVMKHRTDLGTSGGLTAGAASSDRYRLGGNLGYQRGPATLFATYGYNHDRRDYLGFNDRRRLDLLGAPLSFDEQDLAVDGSRGGHNLTASLDWRLSDLDALSQSLTLNRRSSDESQFAVYTELDAARNVTDRYARPRDEGDRSNLIDYTLAWTRTVEPRAHELSAEIRFNRSRDDDTTLLWRQPVADPTARTELERDRVNALTRELTGQVDWVRTFGGTKLEAGYKGNARWNDRDFTVVEDPTGVGTWTPSDLSNALSFDEHVQAVYGVLSHAIGKVQLQGGLRAEYANREFTLSGDRYPHDYTSLFPSGTAVWDATDRTQLKASYSRRIRRPNSWELNPFPMFFDTQDVFIGSPTLDPEYTDAFELGYTRQMDSGSIQVSPYYRHTTDIIRFVVNTDDVVYGREVTSIRFENLATSDSWGTDVNGSLQVGKWFNGFAGLEVYKQVTDGGSVTSLASNTVTWSARVNGTVQLSPSLSVQGMAFYQAPTEFETGKFSSFKFTSLTIKQKVMDDRGSLSLRVNDPFKTMGFRVEAGDSSLVQVTRRDFDARSLYLTFQYSFGRAPKVRHPRPDAGQEGGGGIFPQ